MAMALASLVNAVRGEAALSAAQQPDMKALLGALAQLQQQGASPLSGPEGRALAALLGDRKSTRLNSSH